MGNQVQLDLGKERLIWLLKIAAGPLLFLLVWALPLAGLATPTKLLAATYVWVITWWVLQPVPWGVSSVLPLAILPLLGVIGITDVCEAYGQKILFFIVGVLMVGYAVEKHGLGRRIALRFLSFPIVGNSVYRILFAFMATTAVVSAFVDDAACVAIMTPIGLAIARYAMDPAGEGKPLGNVGVFMALGVLYSAEAGGIATVMGLPHNAVSIGLLEQFNNISIDFVQWMQVSVVVSIVSLVAYYYVLRVFAKPEIQVLPGAREYFQEELEKLGPMSPGERNTAITLVTMAVLWILPTFVDIRGLDVWIPPVVGLLLLFLLPLVSGDKIEGTVSAADFQKKIPWNIVFLAMSGAAMATLLMQFDLLEWIQEGLRNIVTPASMIFTAGFVNGILTNFVSGLAATNVMDSILLPLCDVVGVNPAIIGKIVPNVGVGYVFPWAGAAAALSFAAGRLKMGSMIKIGFVALLVHVIIVICINMLLVPVLPCYTVM